MKWAFNIQRRMRIAILLALLMFCLVILSLVESYNLNRSSKSFNSIFSDRLIPAVDLYTIHEHLSLDQDRLTDYFSYGRGTKAEVLSYLTKRHSDLLSLLSKYENTYLVENEKDYLERLKSKISTNHEVQLRAVRTAQDSSAGPTNSNLQELRDSYRSIRGDLNELVKIQTEVGKNLLDEYRSSQANSLFVTNMQLVVAIVLGILIVILVITDKQVRIRQERFNLN